MPRKPPATPTPRVTAPKMQTVHRRQQIAILIATGRMTYRQIAEIMGCTRAAAKALGRDPRVRELVAIEAKRMADETRGSVEKGRDIIKAAIPMAAARLQGLVRSTDERVALRAATGLLDRGGIGIKQELRVSTGIEDATEAELWAQLDVEKRRKAEEAEDDAADEGRDPLDEDLDA